MSGPIDTIFNLDVLEFTGRLLADCADLILTSPPYEDARIYGGGIKLHKGREWVKWQLSVVRESLRLAPLALFVVNSRTRNFQWSPTPMLLVAAAHDAGLFMRKPIIWHKSGIPGSGGPDWLRDDYEFILSFTRGGRLSWSCPTACGTAPRYSQTRMNVPQGGKAGAPISASVFLDKKPPEVCNPGNIIKAPVGHGHLGNPLAHENEAPFPERLVEFLLSTFCKPSGTVIDPFCGSGTTGAVARNLGRHFILNDLRPDQCELSRRRIFPAGLIDYRTFNPSDKPANRVGTGRQSIFRDSE